MVLTLEERRALYGEIRDVHASLIEGRRRLHHDIDHLYRVDVVRAGRWYCHRKRAGVGCINREHEVRAYSRVPPLLRVLPRQDENGWFCCQRRPRVVCQRHLEGESVLYVQSAAPLDAVHGGQHRRCGEGYRGRGERAAVAQEGPRNLKDEGGAGIDVEGAGRTGG